VPAEPGVILVGDSQQRTTMRILDSELTGQIRAAMTEAFPKRLEAAMEWRERQRQQATRLARAPTRRRGTAWCPSSSIHTSSTAGSTGRPIRSCRTPPRCCPAREYFRYHKGRDVTREQVQGYRDHLASAGRRRGGAPGTGLSPRSVNLALGQLQAAFDLAEVDGRLSCGWPASLTRECAMSSSRSPTGSDEVPYRRERARPRI
jgi:hypothetical protein